MAFSFQTPPPQLQQPQLSPFQTPQQPSSLFQTPQPQQQPSSLFQTPQPQQQQPQLFQQTPFQFQPPQQQQIQLVQQQQATNTAPQQQLLLYTKDGAPAGYSTKWEDLHPDSQKILLQIEERILEYKTESQKLDQCSRLYDSSALGDSFEMTASRIIQELGMITNAMDREKVFVQELMTSVNKIMWDTEFAIRSYMMLRPRFLRQSVPVPTTSNVASGSSNTGPVIDSSQTNQLATGSVAPVFDFYSGLPKRPSLFMEHSVARFEKYLTELCQWIEEVEQLVMMDMNKISSSTLESLPQVMSNVHDFFIYVAAKVENLHQFVESMKTAYLADQRRRGEGNDPFLEASRREAAKQEAAARRVHPTLHLPAISVQPTTQPSGAFTSSEAPTSSSVHPSTAPLAAASGSGFSLFSTPSSAAASSSSFLFSTPTASAPSSTLFGSSGFSPQSTPFGTPASLFGSTQTPSLFASSMPSFGSTPAAGGSVFSTPLAAAGSGTSLGASFGPSKSSRPKSRTSRR